MRQESPHNQVKLQLTGVYIKDNSTNRVTAYFAELPQVIAEGGDESEAEGNLWDALAFMMQVERDENIQQKSATTRSYDFQLA